MTTFSLTMTETHSRELRDHLLRPNGHEHAAYVVCRPSRVRRDPWDGEAHERLLVVRIVPVPDEHIIESTPMIISWQTASFVRLLKEAEAEGYVVGIIHNHPAGMDWFSEQDDANEPDLMRIAVNRNGPESRFFSLLLTADGRFAGRVWLAPTPGAFVHIRSIRVIGDRIGFHYPGRGKGEPPTAFQRQALAFGNALNADLRSMRVGVVGCGGTGSATAILLARLGVGQIVLIDNDIVDRTNLNRLHGSTQADADAMTPKVEVVAREIARMALGVRVVPMEAWVGDPGCRDALRSCDLIFGATDDHDGRLFLNRLAYYYLVPIIDMGLSIDVGDEDVPTIHALDGRVSVLSPGHTCLICRDVIRPVIASAEALRRTNPEEYERRKIEAYVAGGGNPAPAVVTFTTELACMAVNEMIHRLQGFRGAEGSAANRVRKFHLGEDRHPGHRPREGCPVCSSSAIWGRGDEDPFLGRAG
ncbi:ThiF family adenylyltransferase [Aurantimonas sp. C2-6-R+9]|uniref:ThiF family adenylyltransferase n=2 Tax=unclassified Aurantimonas TaxID=2638230 RepID=UPI002E184503|nr:ThiF family adenylyltransferase [Aurantimonas sp. C2-6-R+9]